MAAKFQKRNQIIRLQNVKLGEMSKSLKLLAPIFARNLDL